jgi:hypothetical protein
MLAIRLKLTPFRLSAISQVNMATTTATTESIVRDPEVDLIEKQPQLSHTTTNISMSPELFEKLYLSPKVPHASENVAKYANATPLGFLG